MDRLRAIAPRTRAAVALLLAPPARPGTTARAAALAAVLLVARLYAAHVWWRFGASKLETGWLAGWLSGAPLSAPNPLRPLLAAIAAGQLPVPLGLYRPVAELMLAVRADAMLAAAIPLVEIALAAAFVLGVAVRRWALVGLLVNANLMLSGLGSWAIDGPVMGVQLALLASGAHAARWGVVPLARAAASRHDEVRRAGRGRACPVFSLAGRRRG